MRDIGYGDSSVTTQNKKLNFVLYDRGAAGLPGFAWKIYSKLRVGWVSLGVTSWKEAYQKIIEKLVAARMGGSKVGIGNLQIWAHGRPGQCVIGGDSIDVVGNPLYHFLTRESLVWFRTCSTFFGDAGDRFAEAAANNLGCVVAGHTRVIAFPWQSGLYSLRPKQPLYWPTDRGKDWERMVSSMFEPRTIFAGRMSIPKGW